MLRIDFLPGGNARQYLREGWSFQEPIGIWMIGTESSLSLPPAPNSEAHRLSIKLFPLIHPPKVPRQRFELILNGRCIHSNEIKAGEWRISCVIPEGLLSTQVRNELVVSHPDAAAPRDVAPKSLDARQLTMCFRCLDLEEQQAHDTPVTHAPMKESLASHLNNGETRALVLCCGGEAAREIVQVLRSFPPFDAAVQLRFSKDVASCAAIVNRLSNRDRARLMCVWEQVTAANSKEKLRLKTIIPSSVAHTKFPHLALNCLWPLQGYDPRLVPETLYPNGRYPYTDIAGVLLRDNSANLNDDDLFTAYLELSGRLMPDLDEMWKLDESRWLALDARCDVKITDFIRATIARQRLFYAPELPCGSILIFVAMQLIERLLPRLRLQSSTWNKEFSAYIHGYQGMFYDQAPIHPYALKFFNVPGISVDFEYRREYSKRTFRQHIVDYIRWAPWFAGGRAIELGLL